MERGTRDNPPSSKTAWERGALSERKLHGDCHHEAASNNKVLFREKLESQVEKGEALQSQGEISLPVPTWYLGSSQPDG